MLAVTHTQGTQDTQQAQRAIAVVRTVDAAMYELSSLAVSQVIESHSPMAVASNWLGPVHVTYMQSGPRTGVWMYHIPARGINAAMTEDYREARRGILALLGVEVD